MNRRQNRGKVLREYQKAGFVWMKMLDGYRFGGILADDMGLGKTLQTITLLAAEKEERACGTAAGMATVGFPGNLSGFP